jgi:hypothetical protein
VRSATAVTGAAARRLRRRSGVGYVLRRCVMEMAVPGGGGGGVLVDEGARRRRRERRDGRAERAS